MVTDASLWVGVFVLQDAHHALSKSWLTERLAAGESLVVPTLALAEVAGAVARRTRDSEMGRQAVEVIINTPGIRMIGLDPREAEAAADIAARLFLRGADAVYVSVARALGLPLITWDQELLGRAGAIVHVLHP